MKLAVERTFNEKNNNNNNVALYEIKLELCKLQLVNLITTQTITSNWIAQERAVALKLERELKFHQ